MNVIGALDRRRVQEGGVVADEPRLPERRGVDRLARDRRLEGGAAALVFEAEEVGHGGERLDLPVARAEDGHALAVRGDAVDLHLRATRS